MKQTKIVFVGSHLSRHRGTKGISEKIATLLDPYVITLVSQLENRLLRLFDISWILLIKPFDIVHIDVFSNKGFIYADIASRIAITKNESIIMTLRGGMLAEKYQQETQRVRTVLKRAGVLQSPSLFLIEFFGKQGLKVEYMPNSIDIACFPYGRDNVRAHSLLWVRAFSPEYHPELAIETLHKLLLSCPETTLTMIGPDKGLLKETESLVKKLGVEKKVNFVGKVPNDELYQYYQSHAVYLNTTAYESFGVAILEAAACGIPIVSTKVGEIPYLWVEDKEILMIEGRDADTMAEQIMLIFDSTTLAKKLSKCARAKAERFDWKSIRNKWLDLLEVNK